MAGNFITGELANASIAAGSLRVDTYSADVIEKWLVEKLSDLLGVDPREIDVREPFASYGMGSTEAVSLSGELGDWLGQKVPADLAYEFPTIETLARHLSGSPDESHSANGLDAQDEKQSEPIAIIGIGCRFPGSSGPQEFWQSIRDGIDAITEVPADRFNLDEVYDPDSTIAGKINTRWGGFVEQVDQFDPQFFGISPREAARMDPQQRLLLEVTWEALEDAGQVAEKLAGSQTGVFVGISNNDYGRTQFNDLCRIDAYAGTGNALSIAANRISYLLDFRGPSIAIDTACSSSLVAVHLACASLRNGESTLAVAGGVNLILSPAITMNFTKAGVMAPDGRCKTFDAGANGYVRSEGAGLVVLKPLSRALADGDNIYAVIRGSAVNQDGRSNGLMAPNPLAQEAVLREAYRRAKVSPGDVQYVEAHGTGTLLGDPIEARALGRVLADGRIPGRQCAIGSVKTNIGHCEAAAGVAGLIKVALALKHSEIPASLHFQEPNPHIPFDELPIRVQTKPGPWSADSGPPLAGVSSFGFGGTNAHVVLRQQAPESRSKNREASKSCYLMPLSARSPEALQAVARTYEQFLATSELSLHDVCYSASARRSHHDYRLVVAGSSSQQLVEGLAAFLKGETLAGLSSGRKALASRKRLVFVFSGQGSQWFGMGRTLLYKEPVFREVIERCELAMRPHTDWSLIAELAATDANESRLNDVDVIQPALFAVQVALAALWRSWGIEPDAVVGHSMGEVAAAYVAAALSLEDAALIICKRSSLVKRTVGQGAMASVELSIEDARRAIAGYEDRVSIAVSTSPASTVLSGDPAALAEILAQLQSRDVFCRMVKVDFASHSPQMDPLRGELLQALEEVRPHLASMPIYSTVLDTVADGSEFDALYWARNLREPVLFSSSVQRLLEDGYDTFLEISAHPVLLSGIQQGIHHAGIKGAVLASIRREEDEHAAMLRSLGLLYSSGYAMDWSRIYPERGEFVSLPSYPWQRQRCWLDRGADNYQSEHTPRNPGSRNSLLGRHFKSAESGGADYWEIRLDRDALPFLDDHRIAGVAALPASVYVEMASAAAQEALGSRSIALTDVEFHRPLFLPDGASITLQVIVARGADGAASFQIYSSRAEAGLSDKSWTLHASGNVSARPESGLVAVVEEESLADLQLRSSEKISGLDYYRQLSENSIQYGPFFQSVTHLWLDNKSVLGELLISSDPDGDFNTYQLHPAVLDGCLQVLGAAVAVEAKRNGKQGIYIPTRIGQIRVFSRPGEHLWCRARVLDEDASGSGLSGELRLLDEAGEVVVELLAVHFDSLDEGLKENLDDWLYELKWQPKERVERHTAAASPAPSRPGTWLIFADRSGVGASLQQILEGQGEKGVLVSRGKAYERTDSGHVCIRPDQPEDIRRLFDSAMDPDQPVCRGIVHLWSLDASLREDATAAAMESAQTLGCINALQVVQEMAGVQWREPPRLWLVTQGVQATGEDSQPVEVAQAPLWGLGRVIAQEHPTSWGGLIDLESNSSPGDNAAHQLWEEVSNPDGENQIALRDGRRLVARLARRHESSVRETPLLWRPDGSYLITGGLGDLGLIVARWMVANGARRLILLGRTLLPPRSSWSSVEAGSHLARQIAVIRELEESGASVHLVSADVADEKQMRAFVDEFHAEGWPPIRGVVHAAGVLHDGLLLQLDTAAMSTVLRPKMVGGWLLHRLLREAPLDFFVVFSSAGSLMGQPGQGNYAAANAFLDALAQHRRAQGLTALSINWGAWAELGFAETEGGKSLTRRLALLGIRSMPPKRALEVMDRLLREDATQVVALPVNWSKYHEFYPVGTEPPLLSDLANEVAVGASQAAHPGEKRSAILDAVPAERAQLLQSYVNEQVARVLGLSPSQLDMQQPLTNLGLDSLMAVELKNRISTELGVNVPMVKFLQGFSVAQAAALLLDQLTAEAGNPPDIRPLARTHEPQRENDAADEDLLANIDGLSDEQVNSMLADMLTKDAVT
jgi:acyl transferase domain-containing protein/acyl carrier protein